MMENKKDGEGIYSGGGMRDSVLRVLGFFGMFDYPVTSFEVWQFLDKKCSLFVVVRTLEMICEEEDLICEKNGFYFLRGKGDMIVERMRRYNYTDRKMKKAMRMTRIFRFVPWVKMIAVGNIIGAHNLKDASDIDLLIVCEKNRVWISRFFCTGIAKVLGVRPSKKKVRDTICLSFYVSEEALNLKEVMSENGESDMYFIYWLVGIVPIYDVGGIYRRYVKENSWVREYLPNWSMKKFTNRRMVSCIWFDTWKDIFDLFLGRFEGVLKKVQMRKFPEVIKSIMNLDKRVIVNNEILKMHVNDRRSEYCEKYKKIMKDFV